LRPLQIGIGSHRDRFWTACSSTLQMMRKITLLPLQTYASGIELANPETIHKFE